MPKLWLQKQMQFNGVIVNAFENIDGIGNDEEAE